MSEELRVELTADNSRLYRSRPGRPKECHIRWEAAEYRLDWGIQQFSGPHMLVIDPQGSYGVELEIFFATHQAILDLPHHYIKVAKVRALLVTESLILRTEVNESMEMMAIVPAGAYVVQNPYGERYAMAADEFDKRYELDI